MLRTFDPTVIRDALDLGWRFSTIAHVLERPESEIRRIAWVNSYAERIGKPDLKPKEQTKYETLRRTVGVQAARQIMGGR